MMPAAIRAIREESQRSADGLETGGILLGFDDHSQQCTTVAVAGDPGPKARRGPRSFRRDKAHAQALADAAYESDGSVWVGEWHTHPKGIAEPSLRDLKTYAQLLGDEELDFNHFTSVIVTSDDDWETVECHGWFITSEGRSDDLLVVVRSMNVQVLADSSEAEDG